MDAFAHIKSKTLHTIWYVTLFKIKENVSNTTSIIVLGTIASLRGMLYFILAPNIDGVLGYEIELTNGYLKYLKKLAPNGLKDCDGALEYCSELRNFHHHKTLKHIRKKVIAIPYYKKSQKKIVKFKKYFELS